MWYFTWILGVLLACSFGIINALWLENTGALEDADVVEKNDN
jgi:cyd operon protein YbgT